MKVIEAAIEKLARCHEKHIKAYDPNQGKVSLPCAVYYTDEHLSYTIALLVYSRYLRRSISDSKLYRISFIHNVRIMKERVVNRINKTSHLLYHVFDHESRCIDQKIVSVLLSVYICWLFIC